MNAAMFLVLFLLIIFASALTERNLRSLIIRRTDDMMNDLYFLRKTYEKMLYKMERMEREIDEIKRKVVMKDVIKEQVESVKLQAQPPKKRGRPRKVESE